MISNQKLSTGAISAIYNLKDCTCPVVQVISIKKLRNDRYRLTLSDGDRYSDAVIGNQFVPEKELAEGCLVRIKRYICKTLQGGIKVIVIGKLEVVEKLKLEKIGSPKWVQEEECTTRRSLSEGLPKSMTQRQHQHHQQQQHHSPKQGELETPKSATKEKAMGEKRILDRKRVTAVACLDPPAHLDPVVRRNFTWTKLRKVGPEGRKEGITSTRHAEIEKGKEKASSECSTHPFQGFEAPLYQSIRFISPYLRRWAIKGQCSFKGELRHFEYRNRKGKGAVFSFQLTDNTGSIDVTAFNEMAKAYSERIRQNHIYVVSNGLLRVAHSKFNRSTSFYEMHLHEKSVVREVADDGSIVGPKPKFVKIRDLLRTRANTLVDILGVVEDISEVARVSLRSSGQEIAKRTVTLLDDSNASVSLILWGERVNLLKKGEEKSGKIMMVRAARRVYYEGIELKVGRQTILTINPKIYEAARLQTWYFRQTGVLGRPQFNSSILQLTRLENPLSKDRVTLRTGKSKISHAALAHTEPAGSGKSNLLSFTMRGMIAEFRQDINMAYPSDPITKRKVDEIAPGIWYSPSSDKTFTENKLKWRYALWVKIVDDTDATWMSAFDEATQTFLEHSAGEMEELKKKDKQKWKKILYDACFKPLIIEVIVKPKSFRGKTETHYIMGRVELVNFASEGRRLFKQIQYCLESEEPSL